MNRSFPDPKQWCFDWPAPNAQRLRRGRLAVSAFTNQPRWRRITSSAVLCVIFARRLWHANRLWAPAFAFSAAASLLGGTVHGFAVAWLWKPMVYSVAMPSFFFLFPSLRVVAWAKLAVYASWAIVRDEFKYVRRAAEATT